VAKAGKLKVKWEANVAGSTSATPTVHGGFVYVPDWEGVGVAGICKTGQGETGQGELGGAADFWVLVLAGCAFRLTTHLMRLV
jgi:hypothetical protein